MSRPFTDITTAIDENPIKNGSMIVSSTFRGQYGLNDTYVKNTPIISDIQNKYGNRFYNGIFVSVIDGINGGNA